MLHLLDFNAGEPNRGVAAVAALAGGARVVDVRAGAPLPEAGDGTWILTGGPGSPLVEGSWRDPVRDALRLRVARGLPTFAICYGFEILAWATGARLAPLLRPRLGVHPLRLSPAGRADPLLAGLDGAGTFENRRWGVFDGSAAVLAVGDEGDVVAARWSEAVAGVIFHPEADGGGVDAVLAGPLGVELDRAGGPGTAARMAGLGVDRVHRHVLPAFLAGVK